MDKLNANVKSASGAIKENVGSAFGNEQMQAEGKATRAEGNAEYKKAQAEGYAQGAACKDTVGSAVGNEQMEAEGKAGRAKGDARMSANSN
ncbi:putative cruciform DNA binding protein [Basidiobolus meristosporus CBS 931.73]|uniref:Putative cruciform DNA binding protein n=1 Tax=Basidiobolus meristosporus CBS 931.73 TaxID=1314790 RepID=A0A1Y1YV60_9FUNG|nr:putative cruciform DNA binding protein [Basidiobolus meristosporus CBS 931.73]|eukprot:ORY01617.1 putative cruciform DNA binding protein [Basidiobolus meristosporus CBS 931.73]